MLKNYLKIALRNILKYKGYSLINILGLAIGMACCMVILLYVRHELSFDRFHSKAERIFRLNKIATSQDGVAEHHAISSGAMGRIGACGSRSRGQTLPRTTCPGRKTRPVAKE